MSSLNMPVADFSIVGQLLGFVIKDGYKIKYLRLIFEEREYWIKVPKELRKTLDPKIVPGCWLEVSGTQKRKKTGIVKLYAESIALTQQQEKSALQAIALPEAKAKKTPKASVLVCQKSTCRKRGGDAVCRALEAELHARGLSDRVKIKGTGCLKQCKKGPNVVIMPDKAKYTHVNYSQIPGLIEKHFTASAARE
ncbi:MAG: (2Fe-2S) ferredoxin domain-containing protein [Cyanobacteria bacterium SBLK]|nr:(2Fe-2S) ferredoxin domain-containing protein [Cyanobacteria bacterium SBLK]